MSSASSRGSTCVIAGEREVAVAGAGGDDPAVALEGHAVGGVGAPEVGPPPAISREARVERSVGVLASEGEVESRGAAAG